jgi:hypothetical protein
MNVRAASIGLMLSLCSAVAFAQVDPDAPEGRLPDVAKPSAYRLDVTLLPEQSRFVEDVQRQALFPAHAGEDPPLQ